MSRDARLCGLHVLVDDDPRWKRDPAEQAAMAFHGPQEQVSHHMSYTQESVLVDGQFVSVEGEFQVNGLDKIAGAPYADPCRDADGTSAGNGDEPRTYRASAIEVGALPTRSVR